MVSFSILESSSKNILFVDESTYKNGRPDTPLLQVQFPSLSTTYDCVIIPGEVTVVTTSKINYHSSNLDFCDGLYTLRYSYEPHQYNFLVKKYMRLTQSREKLKSLLDVDCKDIDKETIDKYYEIDVLMSAAESIVETDTDRAVEYFQMIQKKLNKLDC